MSPLLETLPPATKHLPFRQDVLNENRMKATLLQLEPGQQVEIADDHGADEQLFFIMQGHATLHVDELNHVLNPEQALHLGRGKNLVLWNHGATPAKVLQVQVAFPPPEPALFTMPHP